jgi:UV DNA damage endonuclease
LRLGLCCIFSREPIHFRHTTAKALSSLSGARRLARLSEICLDNATSLLHAVQALPKMGIGAFRVMSPIFPRYTHPEVGYDLDDLPQGTSIREILEQVHAYRKLCDIRLSFHPDQFITISSKRADVVENSLRELEYQGVVSELIGAEVINVHGGGAFGDKVSSMHRFRKNFERLSERVQRRLSLENDDVIYTVADLYPVCRDLGIPLVYDVHHHRCNPDGLGVAEATQMSVEAWDRAGKEPYFHISSPAMGWDAKNPRKHADYIEVGDFPSIWTDMSATIDVEAKAKELAIIKLMVDLGLIH